MLRLGKNQGHRLRQGFRILPRMLYLALDKLRLIRHMIGKPSPRLLARKVPNETGDGFAQNVPPLRYLLLRQENTDAHDQQKTDERQDTARKRNQTHPAPYIHLHRNSPSAKTGKNFSLATAKMSPIIIFAFR